jgi:hypothetical protein
MAASAATRRKRWLRMAYLQMLSVLAAVKASGSMPSWVRRTWWRSAGAASSIAGYRNQVQAG